MARKSEIEWTQDTLNPLAGCTIASRECARCYAMTMARRLKAMGKPHYQHVVTDHGKWTGTIEEIPEALDKLARWKAPRVIFVNSMSDMFHPRVRADYVRQCFESMMKHNQHRYVILTKRADIMYYTLSQADWWAGTFEEARAHIALGVSVGAQEFSNRIDLLIRTPATTRILSMEPLLGPVTLPAEASGAIHWMGVGGESGKGRRPFNVEDARDLLRQSREYGIRFFMKQMGGPASNKRGHMDDFPMDLQVREPIWLDMGDTYER